VREWRKRVPGISGKTAGVGKDIIDFLDAVAKHFGCNFVVTSGLRSSDGQARAMYENWTKMHRGVKPDGCNVYSKSVLSEANRKKLDEYYRKANEDKTATGADKKKAEKDFLDLASMVKSAHEKGRAVDIPKSSIPKAAYSAIVKRMTEKTEGRNDIYHFQADSTIAAVTDKDQADWGPAKGGAK